MAYSRGRCTNIDYCPLAASRRDIEVKVGEPFMCPECARPLTAPQPKEAVAGGTGLLVGGAMVALSLIVGGVYVGYRLSSPSRTAATAQLQVLAPRPAEPKLAAIPVPVSAASAATPLSPPPAQATAAPPEAAPLPAALPPQGALPPAPPPPAPIPAPAAAPPPVLASAPPTAAPPAGQAVLLRLTGPATLASALAPRLAAAYLSSLGDLGVSAQPNTVPGQIQVTGQRLSRPETIVITTQNEATGLTALGHGDADIVMAARRINRAELDSLRPLGDLSAPANEHVVGLEGLAVIVNPHNTLSQITMTQLRDVLDGSIATWSALGGAGQGIHVLMEPGAPGLSDLVAGAPSVPPGAQRVPDAAAATLSDPDALAVVPVARAGQARVLAVAVVGASPALPTPDSIAGDAYPLTRRLYLYAPAGSANPFVSRFIAFALSPDGQDAVRQAGLAPLSNAGAGMAAPLTARDRYRQLVAGAARLATDLHFEPGSNRLDLHSAREVDRVWNVMLSDHTPPDHLILIGFADNIGPPEANTYIAKQRAQAVADVFAHRGLVPGKVVSFGPELPIADNATAEGREKNRRVEVFLKP
jgi:phosphate transport system substrate-binding protein